LAGAAAPSYRHGRRSKYLKELPGELKAGYRAALRDPDLAALDGELGLLEVRIGQLLRKLSDAAPPSWAHAVESVAGLDALARAGDLDALQDALARHAQVVRAGADAARTHDATWRQLMSAIELKTKTAAAEWRRQADLGALIPLEQVALMMRAVMEIMREVITARLERDVGRPVLRELVDKTLALLPSPEDR
jgi:hypothetical protein